MNINIDKKKVMTVIFVLAFLLVFLIIIDRYISSYRQRADQPLLSPTSIPFYKNITPTLASVNPMVTYLPNTRPTDLIKKEDDFNRENHPDILIASKTPYETDNFLVSYSFNPQIPAHNVIIVTIKASNQVKARSEFTDWLRSLSLNDQQIQSLDIEYRSQ